MSRLQQSIWKEWGLRFNGTSQSASTGATLNLSTTNKITITGWVKRNADHAAFSILAELSSDYNAQSDSFVIGYSATGQIAGGIRSGGNYTDWYTRPVPIGEWEFFAFSMDRSAALGSVIVGYLNGVQQGALSNSNTASGNFGNRTFYIGARNNASLWTSQSMKDLRIYGSILNASMIADLYAQGANKTFGSPLAWYKMDEGTSTTLTDSGSLADNATIVGRTITGAAPLTMWAIDPVRKQRIPVTGNISSISFNGTSSKVSIANNSALNFTTGDFSFEFKFKLYNIGTASYVFAKRDAGFIGYGTFFYDASVGINRLLSVFDPGGAYATAVPWTAVEAGKWHHVVVSVTRATQENYRVFVNGVYDVTYVNQSTYANAAATITNTAALEFMDRLAANFTKGNVYDVRLYNRALTDDECLSRYYADASITSGRAGYWKMDEQTGTSIADSQGSNTGTLTAGTFTNETMS